MYRFRAVFYSPFIYVYTTVGGQRLGINLTWVERRRTSFENLTYAQGYLYRYGNNIILYSNSLILPADVLSYCMSHLV